VCAAPLLCIIASLLAPLSLGHYHTIEPRATPRHQHQPLAPVSLLLPKPSEFPLPPLRTPRFSIALPLHSTRAPTDEQTRSVHTPPCSLTTSSLLNPSSCPNSKFSPFSVSSATRRAAMNLSSPVSNSSNPSASRSLFWLPP
jgi:hypothetical protein